MVPTAGSVSLHIAKIRQFTLGAARGAHLLKLLVLVVVNVHREGGGVRELLAMGQQRLRYPVLSTRRDEVRLAEQPRALVGHTGRQIPSSSLYEIEARARWNGRVQPHASTPRRGFDRVNLQQLCFGPHRTPAAALGRVVRASDRRPARRRIRASLVNRIHWSVRSWVGNITVNNLSRFDFFFLARRPALLQLHLINTS